MVKNLPAMPGDGVRSPGQEDPLEEDGRKVRKRAWQPILVLLPRESHGQRSLAGCSP